MCLPMPSGPPGFEAAGKKGKAIAKAIQIKNTLMDTAGAAVGAFKAMVGIPIIGPALAVAAAATATAFGLARVNQIRSLQEGGIIRGTAAGTLIRAGEGGKDEAIVPLENADSGGLGGRGLSIGVVLGSIDREFIEMIDTGLDDLARTDESKLVRRIIG